MLSNDSLFKDGKLRVFILGSGGPMNNNVRVSSSFAVITEDEFIIIDIGPGSYRNVDLLRLPASRLNAIFLTHFHSDHIGDLGEANMMSWVAGRQKSLEVFGPEGIDTVVNGFKSAYSLDTGYRIAHHGEELLNSEKADMKSTSITIKNHDERDLVYDRNDLKVYAFVVDHSPVKPALGYRVEYKGKVVVFTGDTVKNENVVRHCQNADILISEAISFTIINNMIAGAKALKINRIVKILTDIQDYHMEPVEAAKLAKEAQVKTLIFVHITPPLNNENMEKMYLQGVGDIFEGEIILGRDQMKFELDTS
jgi:ribonuclease Z